MSKPGTDVAKNFIDEVTQCLKNDRTETVLHLFEDEGNETMVKELSWEIVPLLSSYLTTANKLCNPELIDCCETVLDRIAEKCNPSEVVLELLEQAEYLEDDLKFCLILKPLSKTLHRMPDKAKAIEWCISTIRSYVEGLSNERETIYDDDDIKQHTSRITNVYSSLLLFLQPLIDESALGSPKSENNCVIRDYLLSVLIFLLGKPLCYLEKLECQLADCQVSMPEYIIIQISRLRGDLLWFLNIIDTRNTSSRELTNMSEEECVNLRVLLFESNENISQLAYANFYFYISTTSLWIKVPHVYNPTYIFYIFLYLVNCLLKEANEVLIAKGLDLMQTMLQRIEKRSFTVEVLELSIYLDMLNTITKVMIYCNSKKIRKNALFAFQDYIQIFNMEARYYIVLRLYEINDHSGLLGFTTGILKTSIIECLATTPPSLYFLGNNLKNLLNRACKLPHGSASDLVELSDEIITSLNLLRFLFIRDKNNETGIWDITEKLKTDFLNPLREGIDLSKTLWKIKIRDLKEQEEMYVKRYGNIGVEKADAQVTLIIGGEKLPAMPVTEKITICYQAVNGLDVMESILIRVNECITDHFSGRSGSVVAKNTV